jgi:hypothetical protein
MTKACSRPCSSESTTAHIVRAEEEVLPPPAYARHAACDRPEVVRVPTEHVDLRRRGQELEESANPDPSVLRELGERLERHIRFEERELFPMVEAALPDNERAQLGTAFARADAGHG